MLARKAFQEKFGSGLECWELSKWDINLELSTHYTKSQVLKILNLSYTPSRIFVPFKTLSVSDMEYGHQIALRGGNFRVTQDIDVGIFKEILRKTSYPSHQDTRYRVYLSDKKINHFTRISNFWPANFRWL